MKKRDVNSHLRMTPRNASRVATSWLKTAPASEETCPSKMRDWRNRGTFGPASPVRRIDPKTGKVIEDAVASEDHE